MFRQIVFLFSCFFFFTPVTAAQDVSVLSGEIERIADCDPAVTDIDDVKNCRESIGSLLDNLYRALLEPPSSFVEGVSAQTARSLRFRRADIQVGASSGSSGSTSAVLDPLIPAAFGFALENGSLTRSIDGTTATIKINPAGLLCSAGSQAQATMLRQGGCADRWQRLGISLSFDMSRGEDTAPGVKPIGDQFAELALRFELVNQRKPSHPKFRNAVEGWAAEGWRFVNQSVEFERRMINNPTIEGIRNDLDTQLKEAVADDATRTEAEITSLTTGALNQIRTALGTSEEEYIRELSRSRAEQLKANREVFNTFAHAWVVTAEYTYQRPDLATEAIGDVVPAGVRPPSLHTLRLIAAKGVPKLNLDFTFNASGSWFDEDRANLGRWRDARLGVEGKFLLKEIPDFGNPVLSFAGLWMHLRQPPLGFQIQAFNEANINQPGNLGLFQTKLEIPTANASVRIPISFTYASRTELIKESDVRGQIGFTLNLDTLFPSN